jgi:hypothetical protein
MPCKRNNGFHLRCGRATKYFVLLLTVIRIECYVCFLALAVQHAMRMRLIMSSSVACLGIPYFNTLGHKRHKSSTSIWSVGLVFLRFSRLPEDGTWVPKHVEIYTYHELYFMICICIE